MPYSITDKNADCSGWAVVDPDNKIFGCHTTKASAIKQAVAISLATDEPFIGERKADGTRIIIGDIDNTLLSGGRRIDKTWEFIQAEEGLLFIVTGRPESRRAETEQELEKADISYSRLIMNPGSTSDSPDYKKATAEKLLETYNIVLAVDDNAETLRNYRSLGIKVVSPRNIRLLSISKLEATNESESMTETRAELGELAVGDYVAWLVETEAYAGEVVSLDGEMAVVRLYEEEDDIWADTTLEVNVAISELKKIQPLVEPVELPDLTEQTIIPIRSKWVSAAWAIKAKIEGLPTEARAIGKAETRTNHMELRAVGDGKTFEGYAAKFNSPSEPLPFTEIIKPGAFTRSLKSRNRMMLLWNHDSSNPLASTRNGSLQMREDEIGLKVIATLPDTTLGRDIAELIRTGVVDAMSFGFAVKKDSWTADGRTRYLEDVSLSEVSLVSFPAYEGTANSVSVRDINPDQLAEALLKLEQGEELETNDAQLINEIVGKLQKTDEVAEVEGDILALKQKKLSLLLKEVQDA